ncbi:MAG: lipoprotein LipL21, partial [Leptospiraceae bacterium]|nr:lipoprotein LipL21 [Leptospiraceae bacterium]
MKKLILLATAAILGLTIAGCSGYEDRRDATTVGTEGWVYEGWSCAPNQDAALRGLSPAQYCADAEPEERQYLYMIQVAAASDRAIRSGRLTQMQSTCKQAAKDQVLADALTKFLGTYLEQAAGVSDGQSTGQAIIQQNRGRVGAGIGIYDCCAVDPEMGTCAEADGPQNWEQCKCVGYMRWPGGQEA